VSAQVGVFSIELFKFANGLADTVDGCMASNSITIDPLSLFNDFLAEICFMVAVGSTLFFATDRCCRLALCTRGAVADLSVSTTCLEVRRVTG